MKAHEIFVQKATNQFNSNLVSIDELKTFSISIQLRTPWAKIQKFKVDRNNYCFQNSNLLPYEEPAKVKKTSSPDPVIPAPETSIDPDIRTTVNVASMTEADDYLVPTKDPMFIPFGVFADLNKIIKTGKFMPVFMTGESGIGKTLAVIQSCARNKKELIRFNVTNDTNESDLFGDFRLINGDMIFSKGPVLEAMERGAVLLLDELSAGNSNKLLALQSVLEGNGAFVKKIGKKIVHKEGFNIIATDNSKGKGSESGRYIGLNVLNEAFLDRFVVTLFHTYPTKSVERRILKTYCTQKQMNQPNLETFCNCLSDWAEIIRKTYMDDGCDEVISTRRLVNICNLYDVFDNKKKAIDLAINRFDEDTIESFSSLFNKLWDGDIEPLTQDDSEATSEPF